MPLPCDAPNPYLREDFEKIGRALESAGLPGRTVLVTGATGLIGSLVVRAAAAYNKTHATKVNIIAFARDPEKKQRIFGSDTESVEFIYQDICAPIDESVPCDYIIHTANSTSSKQFVTTPVEVMESIYQGTMNVLEHARLQKAKGVVYLSSMEVYGAVRQEGRLSENDLGYIDLHQPRSCYSEGKRAAECLCGCYAAEYQVPVRIARLAQTFGAGILPWEGRAFAQFAKSAKNGRDVILHTDGLSMGNYVYTGDAIAAILTLLNTGAAGEAYTVANEESTMRIRDLAQIIIEEAGQGKAKLVFDIPDHNLYGYAPKTMLHLSSAKMRALGWSPEIGIREAIQRMLPDIPAE